MSEGLNILVGADVLPDLNSGAAGTVMETSKALAALGSRVESFWSDALGRRIRHGNLHYILELPRAYRRVVRERLARERFDVVQLSQPHSYLTGRMILKKTDGPLMVWRSHGLEAKVDDAIARFGVPQPRGWRSPLRAFTTRRLRWAQREAVKWSDGTIVPCADDKRYLMDHFGASDQRVRVIWHGVPDEYIDAPLSGEPQRWQRMLHVSQLSANKGPMVMHEVAAKVLASRPELSMTWVCPLSLHEQLRNSLPESLKPRILLRDWVSRDALMELYDAHGLFLFPTLAEGAAKVVMEAMARGMCVVSSDTSGPRDYIHSGVNGVLVPVGDAMAMARAAERLVESGDECQRMGAAARITGEQFRWSRCARQMLTFYADLRVLRAGEGK
jgi:glycosyltransferase involved in cell wall biosynthesis